MINTPVLDGLRIEEYFLGCDYVKDEARLKEAILRLERELRDTEAVMLHDLAIDEIENYLHDIELEKIAELENELNVLDNSDEYPSFEDLKPFGLGDCDWSLSQFNAVTPMPKEYPAPNFKDLTPIPAGMMRTMDSIVPRENSAPKFFEADLSKNKLFRKRHNLPPL